MAANTLRLKGSGDGLTYTVNVEIKFDSDNVYVASDSMGTRIVISCSYTTVVSSYTHQDIFTGGTVRLIGIAGLISITNSKRNLVVPWTSLPSVSNDFKLNIPIAPADITWIENARNGSDFTGVFSLQGSVSVKSKAFVDVVFKSQDGNDIKIPWYQQEYMGIACENPESFRIEREKWISYLTTLGKGAYVIELPIIDLKKKKEEWKKVIERFDKATTDFRNGDFENSIGECRKVVEGAVTVLGSVWKIEHDPKHKFEQKIESMIARLKNKWPETSHSRLDALDKLINAVWDWSGPYHHFEGAIPHRQETSFVLHLTANLVELCAWILDLNPYEEVKM